MSVVVEEDSGSATVCLKTNITTAGTVEVLLKVEEEPGVLNQADGMHSLSQCVPSCILLYRLFTCRFYRL